MKLAKDWSYWESAQEFVGGMIEVVEARGEGYWMVGGDRAWLLGALRKLRWKIEEEGRGK